MNTRNILITETGTVKLADFGISRTFAGEGDVMSRSLCACWYRAPETVFGDPNYGTASDIWSVGCIFAELLLKKPLFPAHTDISLLTRITNLLGPATVNLLLHY